MSYDISQIQQLQSDISTLATNLSNLRTSKIDAVNAVEVNLGDIGIANGVLTLGAASPTDPNQAVTKAYVDALNGNSSQFAAVAITGEYDDLLNKPTIPTNNNQLTNGADYANVDYVDSQVASVDFSDYSNTAQMEIAIDTSNTAMRVYVDAQIANVDFSDYSTTVEIANAISTSNSLMQTYVDGEISTAIANTQNYTDIAIADLVDSAPVTLDTLNELAAALGDDANFSATTSTALGYRLRFDIDTQGLTATQKSNALTNLGISGTFDGTFDGLSSKTSGTGEYSTSGNLTAGRGSGGVSLTTNDGYGNANITWNHKSGVPEQNGNAARIEVNTDSTSGASMYFELKSNVSSGTAVSLTNGMTLTEGNLNINGTITGGFGAVSTSGTTNWNNSTNARSGMGYTLLLGTATNGPGGSYYYHPFSFEYSSKDGSGNMTQFAIPYTGPNLFFRSKYNGAWSGWTRVWTTDNFSSTDISNWNTAYGWGDHASAGYITSSSIPTNYVRDDADDVKSGYLLFNKTGTATSTTNYPSSPIIMRASGWDTNNSAARNVDWYIRAETLSSVYPEGDLVFYEESPTFAHEKLRLHGRGSGSSYQDPDAATFKGNVNILQTSDSSGGDLTVTGTVTATGGNSTNWNTAYGWGDHSTAGYLTSSTGQPVGNYVTTDTTQNISGIKEFQDDVELRFGNGADARIEWNNANSRLMTRVYTHGGYMRFQAENTAGTNRNVLSLSGDTGVTMYHDAAGECAGTKSTGMYSYGLDIAANSTSTIGTRANSLSVLTTGSNSPIACKISTYDTVFSVLPWSSGITYLASGAYYDGGTWVHASDNAYSALLHISGSGVNWYTSSNSSASWNLASNVELWNGSGQWIGDISTTTTTNFNNTIKQAYARNQGWNPAYSNSDEASVYYDFSERAVAIYSSSDTQIGAAYKAMRVEAGEQLRFHVQIKGDVASTAGLYVRIYHYTGDLPNGKTHVSNSASHTLVQEDSGADVGWYENGAITTSYVSFNRTWTAPTTGYVSLVILNWTGHSTNKLFVKDAAISKILSSASVSGFLPTSGGTLTGDLTINGGGHTNLVVDGAGGSSYYQNIHVGESATGSAALHLQYRGDGYAWIGMGDTSTGTALMAYPALQMYYQSNDLTILGDVTLNTIAEAPAEWNPVLLEDGGIVKKDSSVQIHGDGYLRAAYLNMTHASSTRNSDTVFFSSSDTYIRKNDADGFKTSLGLATVATSGSYNDLTNKPTIPTNNNQLTNGAGYITSTVSGSFTATGEVNAYSGAIDLRSDGIYFESGDHCITWNDGYGNFNIRVGHTSSGTEACTEAGYVFHDEWSQSQGWRQFNVSSASLSVGATPTWRTQIYYDYNYSSLRYQGSEKGYTYASGFRVNGNLLATSDVYAYYSDERLKEKTGKIENALDKLDAIETFYYTHNDKANELGYDGKDQQVGVSAQSVEAVMPEVVHLAPIDDDGEGNSISGENYKTVNYARLVPLLIESIKELRAEIEELKK